MRKVVLAAVLVALVSAVPALGQELDGTLKKIKTSGTFTIGKSSEPSGGLCSMRLLGLTSRWTRPFSWACCRPSAAWQM